MERKEKIVIGLCIVATIAAGILHYTHANPIVAFVVTAAALALLAMIVGDATEQLGSRLGIREGDWKFIEAGKGPKADGVQLFNLKEDLMEQKNLAAEKPEIVERLTKRLVDIRKDGRTRPQS